jgi:hypothetical protein
MTPLRCSGGGGSHLTRTLCGDTAEQRKSCGAMSGTVTIDHEDTSNVKNLR